MNLLFIPTLLCAIVLFFVGLNLARSVKSFWLVAISVVAATPGILFAVFYTKVLGEAAWFYTFRSWPFTELSAAGLGLLAGWLQHRRALSPRANKLVSRAFIPGLMVLCVSAPYLKQMFLRPDFSKYENRWADNVCLQSSESSCGPASAATLLRHFGRTATESEIAQESFTTRRGTENWYLRRALRKHGLDTQFSVVAPGVAHLQFPAIAGVRLNDAGRTGHFITIFGLNGDNILIGDPLNGPEELTRDALEQRYMFTGFYLVAMDAALR